MTAYGREWASIYPFPPPSTLFRSIFLEGETMLLYEQFPFSSFPPFFFFSCRTLICPGPFPLLFKEGRGLFAPHLFAFTLPLPFSFYAVRPPSCGSFLPSLIERSTFPGRYYWRLLFPGLGCRCNAKVLLCSFGEDRTS